MSRWIGVAIYTLVLYATLPFGRQLLNLVKGMLGSSFSLSVNLILAGIAVTLLASFTTKQALFFRGRPVFVFAGIVLTLMISPIAMPEERIHLIQYAGLGYLALRAAQSSGVDRRPVLINRPMGWGRLIQEGFGIAFSIVFVVGVGDEIIQLMLPGRVFDLRDILFNIAGGTTGILLQAGTQPGSLSS